jgi:trk system potassium uptake protein TrkH
LSFGGLIVAGTVLLLLPAASAPGRQLSFIDALFTSTSAVCVTGLIVVDTPEAFSTFGEVVLVLLIQAGGLGYMTLSTMLAALVGKRVGLQERVLLQEAFNLESREGIIRFARTVAKTTLLFETIGFVALWLRWTGDVGIGRAAYLAFFHSISAFNNAGFSLFSDNLMRYRGDLVVNVVVSSLIICGGLGFLVLRDLGTGARGARRFHFYSQLSIHTRLVLIVTGTLIGGTTVALFLLERTNPRTLGSLGTGEAVLAAYFQAVSPRTAGFNTLDIGAMLPVSLFLLIVLMFIGASPGGTGGGIKTTTFGVTVVALWATIRGRRDPVVFKRRLAAEVVARAFFISLIAFLALNAVAGLLLITEGRELMPILFETTSAFGTVGLSMAEPGSVTSLAGQFSPIGKVLLMATMFMGRVGPLTLAIAVVGRQEPPRLRYPETRLMIG